MKAFAVFAVVLFFATGSNAASCLEKLPMMGKVMESRTTCITELKVNASDVPAPMDLKEKHFRDQCVSNCSLNSMGFYNNGTFLKEKILEAIKKEAATDVYDKLAKAVETCIEKANKKPEKKNKDGKDKKDKKDGKGKMDNKMVKFDKTHKKKWCQCGKAAKFVHCITEEDAKLC